MLDVSRHFFPVATIKKLLDAISRLKINVFHWHLTDDQGWRIQIDKYPLLTEIGSKRAGTRGDGKPVEGFYTKAEIKEIVDYAAERFIDVVPEIDVPGHMSAAIAAYPEIACLGRKTGVKESFGIQREVACAGREEPVKILEDILEEVFRMFPSGYVHLGGDEALRLNWLECPRCLEALKREKLEDFDALQAYFMGKLVKFANENGKKVLNWNDGMISENADKNIIIHYWSEGKKSRAAAVREINAGRAVVFSPFFRYYMDYPYFMTSLKKAYGFDMTLPGMISSGNVLGVEAALWSEYVDSEENIEYKSFPRLIAAAEAGWSEGEKNYKEFIGRTASVLKIFDKTGVKYATIKDASPGLRGLPAFIKFFKNAADGSIRINTRQTVENKKRLEAFEREKNAEENR